MTTNGAGLDNPKAPLTEPTTYGYLYVGMRIDPPSRVPFVRRSTKRGNVLQQCKGIARELNELTEVVAVTVYEAVVIPPVKGSPRFDVIVLIQTTSPETIATVEATEAYQRLEPNLVMAARNVRRIGDVDHPRSGTFLFNHFTASDPERTLRTLEDVAGWFSQKVGVDDSALLQPTGAAAYAFVNHLRLPCSPIRFFLLLAKPSFRKFVLRKLNANQIGFAPVVCKPV